MPRPAKEHVCQVAAKIPWHREPGPHMAECSGCGRNDLRHSSSGGNSHSTANPEDPNDRSVQLFFQTCMIAITCTLQAYITLQMNVTL